MWYITEQAPALTHDPRIQVGHLRWLCCGRRTFDSAYYTGVHCAQGLPLSCLLLCAHMSWARIVHAAHTLQPVSHTGFRAQHFHQHLSLAGVE